MLWLLARAGQRLWGSKPIWFECAHHQLSKAPLAYCYVRFGSWPPKRNFGCISIAEEEQKNEVLRTFLATNGELTAFKIYLARAVIGYPMGSTKTKQNVVSVFTFGHYPL